MGADPLSFLGFGCPENLRLRRLILQARDALEFDPADWADTLVVVERGALEVECRSGARACFREGAVLVLAGLTVRRLRNAGSTPLVLSALARRGSVERGEGAPSDE